MTTDRATQVQEATSVVRELLASSGATRVVVEVTRGGTLRIDASVSADKPQRAEWSIGRERRNARAV